MPPTGERVVCGMRTLPGCEPGPCALRDTVPSMEGQRWRRRDGLRGDWASCPFGCTPPRSRPSPSFSFQSDSCQALPIAKAIFPDSMGLFVRVEPSPSRARRRPGSGPCPSLAGRSEGRCERLAQTSADWLRPWPGQPRGSSPAMIRSRPAAAWRWRVSVIETGLTHARGVKG